jgi:hypothetical protein
MHAIMTNRINKNKYTSVVLAELSSVVPNNEPLSEIALLLGLRAGSKQHP